MLKAILPNRSVQKNRTLSDRFFSIFLSQSGQTELFSPFDQPHTACKCTLCSEARRSSQAIPFDDHLCFFIVNHSPIALHGHKEVDAFIVAILVIAAELMDIVGTVLFVVHHAKMLMIKRLPGSDIEDHKIRSCGPVSVQIKTGLIDIRDVILFVDVMVDDFDSGTIVFP